MKNATVDYSKQGFEAIKHLGYNLIKGIEPTIFDADGNKPKMKNIKNKWDENAHNQLTIPYDADHHIDIFAEQFKIIYDLGKVVEADGAFLSGESRGGDYIIGNYELYASETLEDLFKAENRLIEVDTKGLWKSKNCTRVSEAFFTFDELYKVRYFALKVNRSCARDEICRLAVLELYNSNISRVHTFTKNNFPANAIAPEDIAVIGNIKGDKTTLTNGLTFDGNAVVVDGKLVINTKKSLEELMVTGLFNQFKVYTSETLDDLFKNEVEFQQIQIDTGVEQKSIYAKFGTYLEKYVGISFDSEAVLDQIGGYTNKRYVTVDLNQVRTPDFMGIGANELPMAKMPESRLRGFRDIYWPFYEHRIIKSKPSVLRVWFQPDWVVDNEEDYKKGICDFNTQKMKSIFDYLDIYEKTDIEIEFNFGWKASTNIQKWFTLDHVGNNQDHWLGKSASIPKDFKGFAKCCATVMKEICINRGYKCVKHLALYNESCHGDATGVGADFLGHLGESKKYWCDMMREVDIELRKEGLDKYIDYWMAEESREDRALEWIPYVSNEFGDAVAMHTYHQYDLEYNKRTESMKKVVATAGDKPVMLTEFACYGNQVWEQSNVEYVMSMMKAGTCGGLYWTYQGVMATDPTWMYLNSPIMTWWTAPYEPGALCTEAVPYHQLNLFTHYCPAHSKVYESQVDCEDVRAEVIETPDGNYTVFVETKKSDKVKSINISFGKEIGRKFRKHVYRPDKLVLDGNLMVPSPEKEIEVTNTLCDVLGTDYCLIAYTTCEPFKQVRMNTIESNILLGEQVQLSADLVDCEGELVWEIVDCDGPESTIDQNGLFTAMTFKPSTDEKYHFKYVIKAYLKDDPMTYAMAMVKVHTAM